jgi:DNA-directed RNA polymerase subunit beta'
MNRNGAIIILDERGREVARYQMVYGAHIHIEEGKRVKQDQMLATWDPYTFAILTEVAGQIKFQDLKEGMTVDEEVDEVTGQSRMVVRIRLTKRNSRVWKSVQAAKSSRLIRCPSALI